MFEKLKGTLDSMFNQTFGDRLKARAVGGTVYDDVIGANRGTNVFQDWLHPALAEERHLGQQLMMDELEPQAKMAGLKAAGINPLTAAAGLAGSGGSSPIPASPESSNPIGDVASAVGSLAGGVDSVAKAFVGVSKLPEEIGNIRADTSKKFADIGLTNAQTQGVLTDNSYKDEDWRTRLNIQRQQFENMQAEYKNILANHDMIMQKIKESISQVELNGSMADYYDNMKLKIDEDLRWQKELNDFRIAHKLFINESGIDGYIWSMCLSGVGLDKFDEFIDVYSNYRGSVQSAVSDAEYKKQAQYAYSIANAQETAKSLNQIVTDWNSPANGIWSILEKSFGISGNRSGKNNIGSALDAKNYPDEYASYTQLLVALQLSLDSLNGEMEAAAGRNDLKEVRNLARQKSGLEAFIRNLTFDDWKKHLGAKL